MKKITTDQVIHVIRGSMYAGGAMSASLLLGSLSLGKSFPSAKQLADFFIFGGSMYVAAYTLEKMKEK